MAPSNPTIVISVPGRILIGSSKSLLLKSDANRTVFREQAPQLPRSSVQLEAMVNLVGAPDGAGVGTKVGGSVGAAVGEEEGHWHNGQGEGLLATSP